MGPAIPEESGRLSAGRYCYLGLLPVAFSIVAIVIFRLWFPISAVFERPLLLAALNTVFLALMPFVIAYLAARSYVAEGDRSVLLTGCALLVFGMGNLVAGWAVQRIGPNITVTIHNLSALVASVLYVVAAFVLAEETTDHPGPRRKFTLILAYCGVLFFITLVTVLTAAGLIPPFYLAGKGPTSLREVVVFSALLLHVLSAFFILRLYSTRKAPFLYWYGVALLLIATGLLGVLLQRAVGSPIGWVGRISQYIGGVYLLAAAIVLVRQARTAGTSVSALLSSFFRESEVHYRKLLETAKDAIISTGARGQVILWNPAAEALFGFRQHEAIGACLSDLIGIDSFPVGTAPSDPKRELMTSSQITLRRRDASTLFAEVSAWTTAVAGEPINTFVVRDVTERKRAEEAARKSDERLRFALATVHIGAWDLDLVDHSATRSLEHDRIFGYETLLPEWTYEMFLDHVVPEDLPTVDSKFGHATNTQGDWDFECRIRRCDGQIRWIRAAGRHTADAAGTSRRIAGIVQDITEHKLMEEALRQNEERLRRFYESGLIGVIYWNMDGRIEEANDRFLAMVGYTREDLAEGKIDWIAMTPAEHRHVDEESVKELKATGANKKPFEKEFIRKDGTRIPVVIAGATLDEARTEGVAFVLDIADRKRAEEELRTSHLVLEQRVAERTEDLRRQAELLELAHNAIIVTDMEGRITFWNRRAEEVYGWTKAEALGYPTTPLLGTQFLVPFDDYMAELTKTRRWEGELTETTKSGRQIVVLSRQALQVDGQGNPLAVLAINLDITETRRTEQLLRQSQKMEALGTLTGGIAHDFNNILAAIIGFAELIEERAPKASAEARHAASIFRAGVRGRDLIKQMLAFSRKSESRMQLMRLSGAVREAAQLLRASIPSTIKMRTFVDNERGLILADPTQIQQVLMNLCTNSAHAMREKGGVLDIRLQSHTERDESRGIKPGPYMKLIVSDTGTGIEPGIIERIFDPFFTTKQLGEGTGLGLSVVHGIVKHSGGHIAVESEPGSGTSFTVYFPTAGEDDHGESAAEAPVPTGKGRVLFVDDEELILEMGEEILTGLGYQVELSADGEEALRVFALDPTRFDLIITDQTMPGLTGVDLAREILAIRSDIPIILCTGYSHAVDADQARAAGIRLFVMKPLTKREIAECIKTLLDK